VCPESKEINIELTKEDIYEFLYQLDLDKVEISKAYDTLNITDQKINFLYQNGKTKIRNVIEFDKELGNFSYTLFIPKCLTKYLDDLEFDNQNYTIIEEDPVIEWEFTKISENINLDYEVKGIILSECIEKIKGLPIANTISEKTIIDKSISKNKLNNILYYIVSLVVIFLVIIVIIIYMKNKPKKIKLETESDYEQDFIEKQRQKYFKQVKDMKFKSNEQAENYMKKIGLSDDEQKWILKKL
jgi:hypothetical protein